ncbi:uncharacterized protein SCHCODRAFT_02577399 [Schizophyllum commune H4-8]|uniref:uncharacterized protein n=1 Tax=Schizophyllum commune (strain H4-8 / FGSC 9210) TaxID=578458 RepID=UPI00215E7578|nr:uncharacterized protein SCHCODRAFT_02577399 [Schizophyllum commune H4-8]KAI5894385.1 hypothetical protein SCHCODRAFT_02577399 [Schizophyllum commune H4-8]
MALVTRSARVSQASPFATLPLEIWDNVAELLHNHDRVSLAQVGSKWIEIAERHIWRDLPTVALLLLCLPPDSWCINRVSQPAATGNRNVDISCVRLKRKSVEQDFIGKFERRATYVRTISVHPLSVGMHELGADENQPFFLDRDTLDEFMTAIRGQNLFKCLHTIHVGQRVVFLHPERMLLPLMTESLKTVSISCPVPGLDEAARLSHARPSGLTIEGINSRSLWKGSPRGDGGLCCGIVGALEFWIPSLTTLDLALRDAESVMPIVVQGKALRSLSLHSADDLEPVEQHSLYSLRSLSTIRQTAAFSMSLLGSRVLEEVNFSRVVLDTADDVSELLSALGRCPTLRRISVVRLSVVRQRAPESLFSLLEEQAPVSCSLRPADLAPLLSLKNLEKLVINATDDVRLADMDYEALAGALPALRTCSIGVCPGSRWVLQPGEGCTLYALESFAAHCRSLEELSIQVDALSGVHHSPKNYDGTPFRGNNSLRKLNVGRSMVSKEERIAVYLHAVFPSLSCVESEPCEGRSLLSSDSHVLWKWISRELAYWSRSLPKRRSASSS